MGGALALGKRRVFKMGKEGESPERGGKPPSKKVGEWQIPGKEPSS